MKCDHLDFCSHCKHQRDVEEQALWKRISELSHELETVSRALVHSDQMAVREHQELGSLRRQIEDL
jgi:hypothetical protein